MRADRLVAALLILQSRGRVTARQLAAELEVSVRTARRDLEALSVAGLPVYAQPGRGGGWTLLGGARTDLSGLTAAEAHALFLLVGPAAPASPNLKAALRKLVQALPATFRADAAAAASAVVIDAAGWGGRANPPPPHLEALRQAVVNRVQVRIAYSGRTGRSRWRTVHPLGVVQKGSTWYLVAGTRGGVRTFRVDRVRSLSVTARAADRPEGFVLAEAWRSLADAVEARRRQARAVVRAAEPVMGWLRIQFGEDLTREQRLDNGRREAEILGGSAERLADQLAGWGRDVEVVGPADVRAALRRIGQELVDAYG